MLFTFDTLLVHCLYNFDTCFIYVSLTFHILLIQRTSKYNVSLLYFHTKYFCLSQESGVSELGTASFSIAKTEDNFSNLWFSLNKSMVFVEDVCYLFGCDMTSMNM